MIIHPGLLSDAFDISLSIIIEELLGDNKQIRVCWLGKEA